MVIESKHRPFHLKKTIKELVQRPSLKRGSAHLPNLPSHDHRTDEYAYDILYECQRGSLTVGYSSKTLLQFDPNPWCDAEMRFTPMNVHNYQLPDPTWEWISKDWMIDMADDVDEAGWQYALKFHGAVWHGNYKHFRSFVRRRRWIRLRHRSRISNNNDDNNNNSNKQGEEEGGREGVLVDVDSIDQENTLIVLQKCRLDREKLDILCNIKDKPSEWLLDYIQYFDHEETKVKFIYHYFETRPRKQLTEKEKKAIQSLAFDSDVQAILNKYYCS